MSFSNSKDKMKRMNELSFHESLVQKSIISQIPQSNDQNLSEEIIQLRHELQYYKNKAENHNFYKTQNRHQFNSTADQTQARELHHENQKLKRQIQEQKNLIKKISQQLRFEKKQVTFEDRFKYNNNSQIESQRLKQQLVRKNTRINELQYNNSQLHNLNMQQKKMIDQYQRQTYDIRSRLHEYEGLKHVRDEQQLKIAELTQSISEYLNQIQNLSLQIEKLRKQNVIDRQKRSHDRLKVPQTINSRFSYINNSRISEFQMLDNQRINLKIAQKNREYQQLYLKYQSLQNEMNSLEELNHDLQRQRKFLAQRLSDIQIHTEGEEVVGQLQNKLVLMSTQLMRLGNMSRTKTQENKDLNLKIKELILRKQNLEKEVMERDRLILNYKEDLRIYQMKSSQKIVIESRISKTDNDLKQKNTKLLRQIERITGIYKQKLQIIKNLDIKVAILQQKNSRLAKQYQQLQKENKDLIKNNSQNKNFNTQMMNIQAEAKYYKENNMALKEDIRILQSRVQESRIKLDQITREKEDARYFSLQTQDKVTSLQEQIRRINVKLDDKQMQLKQLNHKNEEKTIIKLNQIKMLQQKIWSYEKQIERNHKNRVEQSKYEQLMRQIQRLQAIQLSLKLQISSYEEKIAMLAQQNQRLSFMMNNMSKDSSNNEKLRAEAAQKDKKIRQLTSQVQILSNRQKNYKQQINNFRQKARNYIIQQRAYEDHQFKNRQLIDEIQTLKMQLSVRENELKSLTQKYTSQSNEKYLLLLKNEQYKNRLSTNYNTNNNNDGDRIQHEMLRFKQQNQRLYAKINEWEHIDQQKERNYEALSEQILRLNKALQKRSAQITNYKKQIDFFKHQVKVCEQSLEQRNLPRLLSQKSIIQAQSKTKIEICQGKLRDNEGELQLWKQKYNLIKQAQNINQNKISSLLNDKLFLQQKVQQLQYTLSKKAEGFKDIEQSFKLTIMQIKKSNQRLEQGVKQIQNHYIGKLQFIENECSILRSERRQYDNRINDLQKRLSTKQLQYGSQIKQKLLYINNLSNNNTKTKEQIQQILKIKNEYQIKITTLGQQILKLNNNKQQQNKQYDRLVQQIKKYDNKFISLIHQQQSSNQTIETLSAEIQRLNLVLGNNIQKIKQYKYKINRNQAQYIGFKQQFLQTKLKLQEVQRKLKYQRDLSVQKIEKLQQFNKDLKYQIEQKNKDNQRINQKLKKIQSKENHQNNQNIRNIMDQIKLLRQSNQNLEKKLGLITREYQQLVSQLEYYKRPKSNHEHDEKMRIIGNYEATIKHIKEENHLIILQKSKAQNDIQKLHKISHEIQQRLKISQEKSRIYQQKSKRLQQRNKQLEERFRNIDDTKITEQRSSIQKKLISAMEQINRLQIIIKNKDAQIQKMDSSLKEFKLKNSKRQYTDNIRENNGIFVIKEVSQLDQRSRSASGNHQQAISRVPNHYEANDLEHRYILLDSLNKKLGSECQCYRSKAIEIEFKFNKLKEEFEIVNKFLNEYQQQISILKEKNKQLLMNGQRGNHHMTIIEHRHQQFSSPQHSAIYTNNVQYQTSKKIFNVSKAQMGQLSPRGLNEIVSKSDKQQNYLQVKGKLIQQIDRLTMINGNLQLQIRDLRLNTNDNLSYRKRYQESMSLMVILFVQIESLRARTKDMERNNQFK